MTREEYIQELKAMSPIERRQHVLYTCTRISTEMEKVFPHLLDVYFSHADNQWVIRSERDELDKHKENTLADVYGFLYKHQ